MSAMEAGQAPGGRPLRVLLSKVGLDGHDRGAKVVAAMLRDAGMEVVYLGVHRTAEAIVRTALEEDVDVVGLSSLGGTHLVHCKKVIDLLRASDMGQLPVVVGGTIPVEDFPALQDCGVRAILRAGSTRDEIVSVITQLGQGYRAAG